MRYMLAVIMLGIGAAACADTVQDQAIDSVAAPPVAPPQPIDLRAMVGRAMQNYPVEALRREEEGTVVFTALVGEHGRVIDCRIDRSSGSVILDEATCREIARYGRFEPARDAEGNPVAGEWSSYMVYAIE